VQVTCTLLEFILVSGYDLDVPLVRLGL